ncbi:MAG TPA: acyl-ACP desaturase [Acidimicrobiia bacterium]|nr:acyl-ACP desaturase [Acidimicrobiia bacterium]
MTLTTSRDLVDVLTPQVEQLFERHLATTKSWMPHELVPWERAVESAPRDPWDPERSPLSSGVRSALVVNLLTEDNLPYYFETINRMFANDVWREWARRWTAEEMRHAIVIRDYITVTHAVDLEALENARMHQVCGGQVPQPDSAVDTLAYVALQELATRISHRNTGNLLDDEAGYKVMARVAADENLHYLFYRDLVSAALDVDPSGTMCAIERQVRTFEMPGAGIPDFSAHANAIAAAGIYDFVLHHDQVLVPVVLRHWSIETIEGLSPEAETARERIVHHIARIERIGKRLADRRASVPVGAGS